MRVIRNFNLLAFCVVGVFLCAGAARADQPGAKRAEPIPFPDGVTDSARSTAFVSSPKGGVQAIRLEDGKVLWTNDESLAEPWLVAGDRLSARGERKRGYECLGGTRGRAATQGRNCDHQAQSRVHDRHRFAARRLGEPVA